MWVRPWPDLQALGEPRSPADSPQVDEKQRNFPSAEPPTSRNGHYACRARPTRIVDIRQLRSRLRALDSILQTTGNRGGARDDARC